MWSKFLESLFGLLTRLLAQSGESPMAPLLSLAQSRFPMKSPVFKLQEIPGSNGRHRIEAVVGSSDPDIDYGFEFLIKESGRTKILLEMRDLDNKTYGAAKFTLAGNSLAESSGGLIGAACKSLNDGWFKCWGVLRPKSKGTVLDIGLLNENASANYPGQENMGVLLASPFLRKIELAQKI